MPYTLKFGARTAFGNTYFGMATLLIQQTGTTVGGNAPQTLMS
jgi:hypothetical protein